MFTWLLGSLKGGIIMNTSHYEVTQENNEEEKEESRKRWLEIILIIIIILLLLFLGWFGMKFYFLLNREYSNINGDTFEITCDCGNEGQLEVYDSDIIWEDENELQIFKNPVYKMDEVIAPGDSNSYLFSIKNKANCDLEYDLSFSEENPFDINMKYRLRINDQVITDDWVDIEDISKIVEKLDDQKEDKYYLEWKWVESSNDTDIGSRIEAYYHLSIEIVGRQVI